MSTSPTSLEEISFVCGSLASSRFKRLERSVSKNWNAIRDSPSFIDSSKLPELSSSSPIKFLQLSSPAFDKENSVKHNMVSTLITKNNQRGFLSPGNLTKPFESPVFQSLRSKNPNYRFMFFTDEKESSQEEKVSFVDLYARAEEFIDKEDLYQIESGSHNMQRSIKSMMGQFKHGNSERQLDLDSFIEYSQSAMLQSPEMISNNIKTSQIFQRRNCFSQTPIKNSLIYQENSPLLKPNLKRINSKLKSPANKETPLSNRSSNQNNLKYLKFPTLANESSFPSWSPLKTQMKIKAISKGCSPALPDSINISPLRKGAHSVHEKGEKGFFKSPKGNVFHCEIN